MTVYWWSHWFWITIMLIIISFLVNTYSSRPLFKNKDKDLKFAKNSISNKSTVYRLLDSKEPFPQMSENLSSGNLRNTKHNPSYGNYSLNPASQIFKVLDAGKNISNLTGENVLSVDFNYTSPLFIFPQLDHSVTTQLPISTFVSTISSRTQSNAEFKAVISGSQISIQRAPFTLENVFHGKELMTTESDHRTRKSKILSVEQTYYDHQQFNRSTSSKGILSSPVSTDLYDQEENISSEALSIKRAYVIDAGTISGICFGVLAICSGVAFLGVILYRRRYLNKPQTLSEPDSSVYIDDSTIKDNSDELYSLDNDSFLNSLEAMTIQNYWTDTVKHTKL